MKNYYNLTEIHNGWLLKHPILNAENIQLRTDEVFFEYLGQAMKYIADHQGLGEVMNEIQSIINSLNDDGIIFLPEGIYSVIGLKLPLGIYVYGL